MLQKRHKDSTTEWDAHYWAEIVVLAGGRLLVHGDIDVVMFSSYGRYERPEQVLYWMGNTKDVGYYVLQKAEIGMGRGDDHGLVTTVESVWLDHALDHIEESAWEEKVPKLDPASLDISALPISDWFKDLLREVIEEGRDIREVLRDDRFTRESDAWDAGVFDWGRVPSGRLIYAHEAVRKVVSLLEAEKNAPQEAVTGG